MDSVVRVLTTHIGDRSQVFVFPSELAASFWTRKVLDDLPVCAVEKRRFISWDRFKEQAFLLNREQSPVNRLTRILFIESELEAHRKAPLYPHILPARYPETYSRFKKDLIGLLPQLASLADKIAGRQWDIARDLHTLYSRYVSFLESRNLFEPSYIKPVTDSLVHTYHVFFPELIEDYPGFETAIAAEERIRVIPLHSRPVGNRAIRAYEFSSQKNEFRWLFQTIREKNNEGVALSDMAVSVPRLDDIADYMKSYARLYDVPLKIRRGNSLGSYPSNRVWRNIADCVSSGFSYDSLKNALLHSGTPFGAAGRMRALVGALQRYCCAGNWQKDGASYDFIRERLFEGGARDELALYSGLHGAMKRLSSASTFGRLKTETQKFIAAYLDMGLADDESLKSFQAGLEILNEFAAIEQRFSDLKVAGPFGVWLDAMDDKLYVYKEQGEGVQVFPYRVAAGISPGLHIIVNASDETLRVISGEYTILSEEQRRELELEGTDFTASFADAYGESGREVYFSFSRDGFLDRGIAPALFLERGCIEPFPGESEVRGRDVLTEEERLWLGGSAPALITGWQRSGARLFSRTGLAGRSGDMTAGALNKGLMEAVLPVTDEGELRISATAIDRYRSCGFRFFFESLMKIEWNPGILAYADARIEGNLEHEILKAFFDDSVGSGAPFLSAFAYEAPMQETVNRVFAGRGRYRSQLLPPEWRRLMDRVSGHMARFLKAEEAAFSGWVYRGGEEKVSFIMEGAPRPFRIDGIVDRLSTDAEGRAFIIDYKKKLRLKKKNYPNGADGLPQSVQIPLYAFLLKRGGTHIDGAAYYDIEAAAFSFVFADDQSRAWCTGEEMDAFVGNIPGQVASWASSLQSGAFPLAADEEECRGCAFRPMCRSRYVVRSGDGV